MVTARLRTLDQAEALFCADVSDFCNVCEREIDHNATDDGERVRWIKGLGDVCLRCFLAEVESKEAV